MWLGALALLVGASWAAGMLERAGQRPWAPATASTTSVVHSAVSSRAGAAPHSSRAAWQVAEDAAPVPLQPVLQCLEDARDTVLARVAYQFQRLGTAHIGAKILALSLAASPLVLIYGALYRNASGLSWRQSFYKVYALLYRVPGIGVKDERTLSAAVVANLVFLSGVFSFAALLGIVGDEIKSSFKSARSGNYPVRVRHHTLVLNWNAQTPAVLRQLLAAQAQGRARASVVILADKDKAEMDALVHDTLRGHHGGGSLEVHTRQGSPFKLGDLRKVAADSASIVILMQPEGLSQAGAEAVKASAAMCLSALGARVPSQRVVVQMPGELAPGTDALSSLARTAAGSGAGRGREYHIPQLPDHKVLHRLVAQTAAQPGLLNIWLDILALGPHSSQFRTLPVPPAFAGATYGELRRAHAHLVVCGLVDPAGGVKFNPRDARPVPPGGQVIVLARAGATLGAGGDAGAAGGAAAELHGGAARAAAERLGRERTYSARPRHIILAGWPEATIADILAGFGDFTPPGSSVTIVTANEACESLPTRLGNCRFAYVRHAHPTSVQALQEAGIRTADTVVLGEAGGGKSDAEADAHVLTALLQVQDAVLACKRVAPPHVVAPIRRHSTSKLARQYLAALSAEDSAAGGAGAPASAAAESAQQRAPQQAQQPRRAIIERPEFLNANDVVSALLTQVAEEPAYASMLRELLFSKQGQELYLRNPRFFNVPAGVPVLFAEVAETVRLTGQTVLGVMRADAGGCLMAPNAGDSVVFGEADRLVCLAEEF